MGRIIARRMYADNKYHYGASTTPAPHLGPLFGITATGDGTLPDPAPNPATEDQHREWLRSLEQNGFSVQVELLDEPAN